MSWKDAMTQNGYTQYEVCLTLSFPLLSSPHPLLSTTLAFQRNSSLHITSPKTTLTILSLTQGARLCNDIASGKFDNQLKKLGAYLTKYPNVHYLFRIDYEVSGNLHANTNPSTFDQSTWDTGAYPKAFAHVRQAIRAQVKNVSFVYHAVRSQGKVIYPGDDVVDFQGFSVFNNDLCLPCGNVVGCSGATLDGNLRGDMEAATKPKIIAESAVQPPNTGDAAGFIKYLTLVKNLVEEQDVVGWTYINR